MSAPFEHSVRVHFSQVQKLLAQNDDFDADGFIADMRDEFVKTPPIALQDKNGMTFYARRSRTENSGWRLEAFESPHETAQSQRIGIFDIAMSGNRRVFAEYTYTVPAYQKRGIYSAMKGVFERHLADKGGKLCRGLTGELSPDGEAIALKRNPGAEALRKLFLKLNGERRADVPDPFVDITSADAHLWEIFGEPDVS